MFLLNMQVLLARCQMDTDDEVRDRATYYYSILEKQDKPLANHYIVEGLQVGAFLVILEFFSSPLICYRHYISNTTIFIFLLSLSIITVILVFFYSFFFLPASSSFRYALSLWLFGLSLPQLPHVSYPTLPIILSFCFRFNF